MVDNALADAAKSAFAAKTGVDPQKVTLTRGEKREKETLYVGRRFSESGNAPEEIVIKLPVKDSMFNKAPVETLRKNLKEWAPLSKWQFDSNETLTKEFSTNLRNAVTDIDGFDKRLLESPVLNTEVAKFDYRVKAYALEDVLTEDYGIITRLTIPKVEGQDAKPQLEALANFINGPAGNADIRATVQRKAEGNLKKKIEAKKAKNEVTTDLEAALAALPAKMSIMVIKAHVEPEGNTVVVAFRSKEQAEAQEKDKKPDYASAGDNADTLRKTNPLYLLDNEGERHPPLQKTLARALLFDADKRIRNEALPFLGRVDLHAALAKEFFKVQQTRPDKAETFKKLLESPVLKNQYVHDPKNPEAAPPEAKIVPIPGENDMVKITLPIVDEDANQGIKALLEAMAGQAQQQAAAAPAPAQPAPAAPAPAAPTAPGSVADIVNKILAKGLQNPFVRGDQNSQTAGVPRVG